MTERTDTPTVTSTALASVITLVTVGALLWQVQFVAVPTAIGVVGALCLAGSLWLVDSEVSESVTALVITLLTVPAGAGFVAAVAVTGLVATAAVFPVEDTALLSLGTLLVVSYAGVAAGCVLALLGLALGVRNVGSTPALAAYTRTSVVGGVVLGVVAGVLVLTPVLFGREGDVLVGESISAVVGPVLAPTPPQLHLWSFALTVLFAVAGTALALAVLPVSELLADTGLGETSEKRVEKLNQGLTFVAFVAGVVAFGAGLIELELSPSQLQALLGTGLYDTVQVVTTAGLLRSVLVIIAGLTLTVAAVSILLRRTAQQSEGASTVAAALFGGLLVAAGVLAIADPVYRRGTAEIAGQLPGEIGEMFLEITNELAAVFGEGGLLVLLATVLAGVPLVMVLILRLLRHVELLSVATTGYSLASAGLLLATAFAGTLDVPAWLVFGGVVASIAVWDAGRFATTLGREVGRAADTRTVELVHGGGTVLVGVAGAGVAVGITGGLSSMGGIGTPATVTALLAVVTGILLFVLALK